jgi:hypothetical protein
VSRQTLLIIRLGVFMAACGFLWLRLDLHRDAMEGAFGKWWPPWELIPAPTLVVLAVLMLCNWGLEALKWQFLIKVIEPVSPLAAFRATIAGTAIGIITPNRVGEFAGRVLFLRPEHRIPGSFATALGSIAQFVVTLLAGALALAFDPYLALGGQARPVLVGLESSLLAVAVASVWFYFDPRLLRAALMAVPFLRRFSTSAEVLERYDTRQLMVTLALSMLRYAVFVFQFILLVATLTELPTLMTALAVPVIFLFTTLVPTVMITELGVRGSVAVALLGGEAGDVPFVLLATFALWLINLALPAMVGSLLLLFARIRTKTDPA